jgi:hypothetical protein
VKAKYLIAEASDKAFEGVKVERLAIVADVTKELINVCV